MSLIDPATAYSLRVLVNLIFLSLSEVGIAIDHVPARVTQGGHNIPEDVIRRRFAQGVKSFDRYKTIGQQLAVIR